MIDAINFGYSSIHAGRQNTSIKSHNLSSLKNDNTHEDFYNKQSNINSLFVVSGGFAAVGIITEILTRAVGLINNENCTEAARNICRTAGIMAIIGATCFGIFKLIENTLIKKVCE